MPIYGLKPAQCTELFGNKGSAVRTTTRNRTPAIWRTGLPLALSLWAASAAAGPTLDAIQARNQVLCGVNPNLSGFSAPDAGGQWAGLDVDICRAVAAAVLQDPGKIRYVPVSSAHRFTALQSGEVDVLTLNTTITMAREVSMGVRMTAVSYYDGQSFMVPIKSRIKAPGQLKGKTVCLQSGSTSVQNLADYSRANHLHLKPLVFEKFEAAYTAYFAGECAAYSSDASVLASIRFQRAAEPRDHDILPQLIAKEPLGPLVKRGDDAWAAIVAWTVYGLIEAEEFGVTQANVDQLRRDSPSPSVQRLLGVSEDTGKLLGLDRDWLVRAIRASGNYGEIFERNIGPKTALGLPRGLNHQWNRGGVLYALPVR